MARKSNMARAGKAAKKAFNEKCRLGEERQKRMHEAENGPLRLREVIPPCIQGIEAKHLDDEMATVAELVDRKHNRSGLGIAINPPGWGESNLRWFKNFWQKKLPDIESQIAKLETESSDSEQLFEAQIRKVRLQATIRYLDELIQMCDERRLSMPVLPKCRSWNYFYTGCPVMAFIPANNDILTCYHHKFISGAIVAVANDEVTVQLDRDIGLHGKTRQLTYRMDSMLIVRLEDFNGSLLCDPYYRGGWLKLSAASEGDPELAEKMEEAYELEQIDRKVGDYQFVAKIRSERR